MSHWFLLLSDPYCRAVYYLTLQPHMKVWPRHYVYTLSRISFWLMSLNNHIANRLYPNKLNQVSPTYKLGVLVEGLEPSRCCHQRSLNPLCLPIPPYQHKSLIRGGRVITTAFTHYSLGFGRLYSAAAVPPSVLMPCEVPSCGSYLVYSTPSGDTGIRTRDTPDISRKLYLAELYPYIMYYLL